jgi:proteasome accessory factor B
MADKKAERLINLTLALLATKRYLKKSEIFRTVEGYSGSAESMDRMFERDKNELRAIGIEISVGDLDPLFDDEPGYKIFKDSYSFQLNDLEPQDVALLSVAAKLWNDSVFGVDAQSSLLKLESLNLMSDLGEDLVFSYRYENPSTNLSLIEEAILENRTISFRYRENEVERIIEPYKIYLWRGYWYLLGRDLEKSEFRNFKISRISGKVQLKKNKFQRDAEITLNHYLPKSENYKVTFEAPEGRAAVLKNLGKKISSDQNSESFEIIFTDKESALKEFLRHGSQARILEPEELRKEISKSLAEVIGV